MSSKKPGFPLARNLLRAMFRKPDPMSQDIGQPGELLTARLRLVVISILAINPIKNTIVAPTEATNWAGLAVTIAAVVLTYFVTRLAARDRPPKILPWLTSQFDILAVSLGALSFIVAGDPVMATNNFVHWTYYMLGIGATCLRHNPRLTVVTVASAILQYFGIALFVYLAYPGHSSPTYGVFEWNGQVTKMIALLLMGILALAIVARNSQVWETSVRDKLTGLHNRRFFDEFLAFKCTEYARHKQPFSLAMIDVDFFKSINDRHGHKAGDKVLEDIGRIIAGEFRSSDMAARWGGEEFAVILSECEIGEAREKLEAFRAAVTTYFTFVKVTVSIGVANYPNDAISADSLMTIADDRLFAAKRSGRDRVVASSA